jgi:5-methylcytosine-specific restriction endonuclease McrA
MSNTYGISKEDEAEIRARDKTCVYCHRTMKQTMRTDGATIEHFSNRNFDKKWNVAICCRGCNSSRGAKDLLAWFRSLYCIEKNINKETVARPVKEYLRSRQSR